MHLAVYSLLFFFFSPILGTFTSENCKHKFFGAESSVCVCNFYHCDFFSEIQRPQAGEFIQYVSSKRGKRFNKITGYMTENNNDYDSIIQLDLSKTYQTILGFGGAFTDSTGFNLQNIVLERIRNNLMKSYFGKNGIGYTFARVPVGATDFSLFGYTYDDTPGDINLTNFRLADADYLFKIPFIKQAQQLTNDNLKLLGTAWSPPTWMKTNNQLYGIGFLLNDMYQPWAEYYLKFLQSYEQEGINFWGLTTGNEPTIGILAPDVELPSLAWTFDGQKQWINENFGPTIKNNYPDIKLLAWDDQRFTFPFLGDQLFNDSVTRKYIDGMAVHWYYDEYYPASALTEMHNSNPDKIILPTEASIMHIPSLGNWTNAERYAQDIIEDLQNWATGWIDWNMALNMSGGPTYIGNYLDSPIIVNKEKQEFYKQPMFYILGHFSKFIVPGSIRIEASYNASQINSVAFLRPDNTTAIIIFNRQDTSYKIAINNQQDHMIIDVPKKSISTILY